MTFNVEEMYLIQELDHRTRRQLLFDLSEKLKWIADPDLMRLCAGIYLKTKAMTDREFAEIDFTAVKEDAEHE